MLLFVRQGDLYERIFRFFHLLSGFDKSDTLRPNPLISPGKQSIIFLNKPAFPWSSIVTSSQKPQGNVCYTPIRKYKIRRYLSMFFKNARIFTKDFTFQEGAFEVVDGKFGAVLP